MRVLSVLLLLGLAPAAARKAFRAGKRVGVRAADEPVIAGSIADDDGNENVELIPNPDAPKSSDPCDGVECNSHDDGGVLHASILEARTQLGNVYGDASHGDGSQSAPVVVTKGFCKAVLAAIKAKQEPYWNTEKKICNAERGHLIAQCNQRVEGFIDSVTELCPNSGPATTATEDAGAAAFKKVTYVEKGDIPKHVLPKEADAGDTPCAEGQKPCKKLKWTDDNKPKKEWAAFPNPPSEAVDRHVITRQNPNGSVADAQADAVADAAADAADDAAADVAEAVDGSAEDAALDAA